MFGFILALLYFAAMIVFNDQTALETAPGCLDFLWYWHVVLYLIMAAIFFSISLWSGAKIGESSGALFGGMFAGGVGLILFMLLGILAALGLGGVYAVDLSLQDASTWDEVDKTKFWVGAALYLVHIIAWKSASIGNNSNKKES